VVVANRVADDEADLLVAVKILRGLPASVRQDAPDGDQCRRQQPDDLHNGHRRSPGAERDYIDDSLKPYGWYKDFVLAGGSEHGLPPEYIAEYIQSVEAIEDPNKTRDKKQRATGRKCRA
jgi:hypothetical protein